MPEDHISRLHTLCAGNVVLEGQNLLRQIRIRLRKPSDYLEPGDIVVPLYGEGGLWYLASVTDIGDGEIMFKCSRGKYGDVDYEEEFFANYNVMHLVEK